MKILVTAVLFSFVGIGFVPDHLDVLIPIRTDTLPIPYNGCGRDYLEGTVGKQISGTQWFMQVDLRTLSITGVIQPGGDVKHAIIVRNYKCQRGVFEMQEIKGDINNCKYNGLIGGDTIRGVAECDTGSPGHLRFELRFIDRKN
jgi:hypothetical protein